MGIKTENLDIRSYVGLIARHPHVVLPPNDLDYYNTATIGTALNIGAIGAAFPNRVAAAIGPVGLSANINIRLTGGATFTGGKVITVEAVGLDHNWRETSERRLCVGDGGAIQNFPFSGLFSRVDSLTLTATTNDLIAGEVFTIGIGDGQANPAAGTLLIQNPIPGAPIGSISFVSNATAPSVFIVPLTLALGGLAMNMQTGSGGINYGATNNVRFVQLRLNNLDFSGIENIWPVSQ